MKENSTSTRKFIKHVFLLYLFFVLILPLKLSSQNFIPIVVDDAPDEHFFSEIGEDWYKFQTYGADNYYLEVYTRLVAIEISVYASDTATLIGHESGTSSFGYYSTVLMSHLSANTEYFVKINLVPGGFNGMHYFFSIFSGYTPTLGVGAVPLNCAIDAPGEGDCLQLGIGLYGSDVYYPDSYVFRTYGDIKSRMEVFPVDNVEAFARIYSGIDISGNDNNTSFVFDNVRGRYSTFFLLVRAVDSLDTGSYSIEMSNFMGHANYYNQSFSTNTRQAMPLTFIHSLTSPIYSLSIYHNGGAGNMLLGVYADSSGSPGQLLGVTAPTLVDSTEGWQTVPLQHPVTVSTGQKVWLSFVFENSTEVRYEPGNGGSIASAETWSSGLPVDFGTYNTPGNNFSMYCSYAFPETYFYPGLSVLATDTLLEKESGARVSFDITSNISWSITDDADWLDVSSATGYQDATVTLTSNSANTGPSRSATVTISGSGVTEQTITITQKSEPAVPAYSYSEYLFEESSGSTVIDSQSDNDGTLEGNVSRTAGLNGGGLEFDGSSYVNLGQVFSDNVDEGLTLSAWIKPGAESGNFEGLIMHRGDNIDSYALYIIPDTKEIGFKTSGTTNAWMTSVNSSLWDGNWHHIAVSYDGSEKVIYLDSVVVGNVSASGIIESGEGYNLLLGAGRDETPPRGFYQGLMDEVQIYNYALTRSEIGDLYRTAVPAYSYSEYLFEESSGSTVIDSQSDNDGTLEGNVSRTAGLNGGGLEFDGSSYVNLGQVFSDNVDEGLTLSAWIKPGAESGNFEGLIMHGGDNIDSYALYIIPDTKEIGFKTSGTTNAWMTSVNSSLWDGNWHHIAVSYDGSEKVIYLDSVVVGNVSASGIIESGEGYNLLLGAGRDETPPRGFYQGLMDEVQIYNYALTRSEIGDLYRTAVPAYSYSEYLFEESSGSTVIDSQSDNDGTLEGNVSRTAGLNGGGLEFDGSSYVNLGQVFSDNVDEGLTLSAWIKPGAESGNFEGLIMHGGDNIDSYALYIIPDTKEIGFKTSGTTNAWMTSVNSSLWDGNWHHIAVSYDGSEKVIYLDSVVVGNVSASGIIESGEGYNLLLGAGRDETPPRGFYQGLMDEVQIYNYALTRSEIGDLYRTAVPAYSYSEYLFEESSGSTVIDSQSDNDGTLEGNVSRTAGVNGGGLEFDGSGYVNLGQVFSDNVDEGLTLSAWIKPGAESGNFEGLIMHGGDNIDSYALYIIPDTKEIGFKTSGTTNAWMTSVNSSLWDGNWHHIAVSYDGSEKVIYLDSVVVGNVSASGIIESGEGYNLLLGAGRDETPPRGFYQGLMDEVQIYNYALTRSEIGDLYRTAVPAPPAINTAGNTEVFSYISTAANRRAVPVFFSENGEIESVSIYHQGGTGNMLLGVYENSYGSPGALVGVTPVTGVDSMEGWQTITLKNTVPAVAGDTMWLSFVFEKLTTVRFGVGNGGRALSQEMWSSGMPSDFGPSTINNYIYSVYCTYTVNENKSASVFSEDLEGANFSEIANEVLKVYPNPFRDKLNFEFVSLSDCKAVLDLYNLQGQLVRRIFSKEVERGVPIRIEYTPDNIVSGVYLYKLMLDGDVTVGQIIYNR